MKKIIAFLGGVPFALFLLGGLLLMVLIGSLIEAYTESHLLAESWSYKHPLFKLFFAFVFLNILVATLRRYPFKRSHFPFILTHLGLLILLLGVMFKDFYAVEGVMRLKEGESSAELVFPESYALLVEERGGKQTLYSLDTLPSGIELIGMKPHSAAALEFFEQEQGDPFEQAKAYYLEEAILVKEGRRVRLKEKAVKMRLTAYEQRIVIEEEGELVTLPLQGGKGYSVEISPKRLIVEDPGHGVHLFLFNRFGYLYYEKMENLPLYAIDGGFQGYGKELWVPENFELLEAGTIKLEKAKGLESLFREGFKEKELVPFLALYLQSCKGCSEQAEKALLSYLYAWEEEGGYLYYQKDSVVENFDFTALGDEWISRATSFATFLHSLDKAHLFLGEKGEEKEIEVGEAELFSASLKMTGISPALFLSHDFFETQGKRVFAKAKMVVQELPDAETKEERRPLCLLRCGKEEIALSYDRDLRQLKWPVSDGSYLLRFQPAFTLLEHPILLSKAEHHFFPGTTKPYSYQIEIEERGKRVTVSMNSPYINQEGYTFLLTSMSGADEGKKEVVLTVSKDPLKKILIYPGSIILIFGIIGLFFKHDDKKNIS